MNCSEQPPVGGAPTAQSDAEFGDILGHAVRALRSGIRIELLLLLAQRSCFVAELATLTELGASGISYHLKILRASGLVQRSRRGRTLVYSLAPGVHVAARDNELEVVVCSGGSRVAIKVVGKNTIKRCLVEVKPPQPAPARQSTEQDA